MSWKEMSVMSQRFEFVQLALLESSNISQLCKRYNISRNTGYRWMKRFKKGGKEGLKNLSCCPHSSPNETPKAMIQAVRKIRKEHSAWGGRKIKARLEALGCKNVPSASTLTAILHRENLISDNPAKQKQAFIRFEHPHPNDLWQMDFKGHFQTQTQRCHPLTVLDDHSRFNLCLSACANEQTSTVKERLTHIFRSYGLPYRMTMDNGSPWGSDHEHIFTPLTLWLMLLGIKVSHSRPYHPQTQGKDERFHRTLKAELLAHQTFKDLQHCQKHFDIWRDVYNLERPHESLDMQVPVCRYTTSTRPFPEKLPSIEYGPTDTVRKIYKGGYFSYKNKEFKIGKAFKGYHVALRPTDKEGILNVYFCHHKIKQIDYINH